ncbi:hypothetical protein [Nocardiopsis sp. CNS-639]|uniref:hypothetical protein n=1 Tax=Nocardiopsis sp. CNS-639 TaxID=1169153 RepID=UPI00037A41C2|nr:hypothetical protein [Nocardiopsis sp. CNS-639]
MGDLWAELGRRLTERWVSTLALPGALYLAVATAAYALGWSGAWDAGHLAERVTGWAADPRVDTFGGQALVLAAVLAGSTAVGLVARGSGWLVERLWTAADWERWPPPLRGWTWRWVRSRRARWDRLRGEVERARNGEEEQFRGGEAERTRDGEEERARKGEAEPTRSGKAERTRDGEAERTWKGEAERPRREGGEGARRGGGEVGQARGSGREEAFAKAYDRMARISPERPERPTWCGDRIAAVRTRLARDHRADLAVLWPHLWLVLPEEERVEVTAAREDLSRATGLTAWGLLYLPLTVWWWPAALVAAAVAGIAWVRARSAAGNYATLVEAVVRLHAVELADRVGVAHEGVFSGELGERLTLRLRASMPPAPVLAPLASVPPPVAAPPVAASPDPVPVRPPSETAPPVPMPPPPESASPPPETTSPVTMPPPPESAPPPGSAPPPVPEPAPPSAADTTAPGPEDEGPPG